MTTRHPHGSTRSPSALIHRGPQALSAAPHALAPMHAPNAALLIDFDNVTMGIRSDLGKELRNLLSSDIIKGKVAVQRAYADWRRYPQYIVPLAESSIDMIMAPAYGSSKKNATDIRLAIDGLELVFTRPEIGTFILLSGDSDFSSLVMKLKEYGKYVIGVGIRESSSDLLVQNCDEYYSYNALAGLVKASDDEPAKKWDPWELVTEAVQRMKRNNDVMRSDRLKQVMQEIDSTFDEKNLGISKFSRFCQEAAQRGLLSAEKLENGQLEVDLPGAAPAGDQAGRADAAATTGEFPIAAPAGEDRMRRGRRGRGGRGRDRDGRETRGPRPPQGAPGAVPATAAAEATPSGQDRPAQLELASEPRAAAAAAAPTAPTPAPVTPAPAPVSAPSSAPVPAGERLTRAEAFDLVRKTINDLVPGDETVRASVARDRAREILGRDSESLSERMFVRILKDAHDAGIVDLRRRGDDFEVARAASAAPVSDQLAKNEQAAVAAAAPAPQAASPRVGMGHRGGAGQRGGRAGAPPPGLLSIGVVDHPSTPAPAVAVAAVASPAVAAATTESGEAAPAAKRGRQPRATPVAKSVAKPVAKAAAKPAAKAAKKVPAPEAKKPSVGLRPRVKKATSESLRATPRPARGVLAPGRATRCH